MIVCISNLKETTSFSTIICFTNSAVQCSSRIIPLKNSILIIELSKKEKWPDQVSLTHNNKTLKASYGIIVHVEKVGLEILTFPLKPLLKSENFFKVQMNRSEKCRRCSRENNKLILLTFAREKRWIKIMRIRFQDNIKN